MLKVLSDSWALLLGLMMLMVGHGLQGTLLGIRGAIEGFSTWQMSVVTSGYSLGFLVGSQLAPHLIARVGHVRVFAALGSLISAVFILYAAIPDWLFWTFLRVVVGFCFAGVYVSAESWLNNAATNETRGQALSAYMIVQMVGIISAQALLNFADPAGYALFVIASVLVSLAFTPILLSVAPAPPFSTTRPLGLIRLFRISPLGCVGIFLMGGVYAAIFGMAAVWGGLAGLTVFEISVFVAAIYFGGLVFQFPIGWLSDRMDRRQLISAVALLCALVALCAGLFPVPFWLLALAGLLIGGLANPLYALLVAHTNDFLPADEMAGASAGLLFINGFGAVTGPLLIGLAMDAFGPRGLFLFLVVLCALLGGYALWRMTRRALPQPSEQSNVAPLTPSAQVVTLQAALEVMTPEQAEPADGDQPR